MLDILSGPKCYLQAGQDKGKVSWISETVAVDVDITCCFVATDHRQWGGVRFLVHRSNGRLTNVWIWFAFCLRNCGTKQKARQEGRCRFSIPPSAVVDFRKLCKKFDSTDPNKQSNGWKKLRSSHSKRQCPWLGRPQLAVSIVKKLYPLLSVNNNNQKRHDDFCVFFFIHKTSDSVEPVCLIIPALAVCD